MNAFAKPEPSKHCRIDHHCMMQRVVQSEDSDVSVRVGDNHNIEATCDP